MNIVVVHETLGFFQYLYSLDTFIILLLYSLLFEALIQRKRDIECNCFETAFKAMKSPALTDILF